MEKDDTLYDDLESIQDPVVKQDPTKKTSKYGTPEKVDASNLSFEKSKPKYGNPEKLDTSFSVPTITQNNSKKYGIPEKVDVSTSFNLQIPDSDFDTIKPEEDPKEQIINEEDRKKYSSDRVKKIDIQKEKIRQEIKELTTGKSNKSDYSTAKMGVIPGTQDVNTLERDNKIKALQEKLNALNIERIPLKRAASPINEDMRKELSLGTSISRDIDGEIIVPDFAGTLKKYGKDKIDEANNDFYTNRFNSQQKLSAETSDALKSPEGAFTMSALKYSPIKISQEEYTPLTKYFDKIRESAEWNGKGSLMPLNRVDRQKIAITKIKEYVERNFSQAEPDLKKQKVYEYSKAFNAMSMFQAKGGMPTVEALQTFAIDQQSDVVNRIGELISQENELKTVAGKGKLAGQEEYLNYITEERKLLQSLQQFNEKILGLPVRRSGGKDVLGMFTEQGAIGSMSGTDLMSLGIKEVKRLLDVKKVSERLERGESLSWAEQKLLETYSAFNEANGQGTQGILYQTIQGIVNQIPYMASFGITKQVVFNPLSKLVRSAAVKVLPVSLIEKSVVTLPKAAATIFGTQKINIAKGLTDWTARGIAVLAQTAANPIAIESYATREEIPEMQTIMGKDDHEVAGELVTTLDKNSGIQRGAAVWHGFINNLGETGFEHSGDYLFSATKLPGRTIAYFRGKPITKELLVDNIIKVGGYKSFKELFEKVTKEGWGWHGVTEEYLEELATQMYQKVTLGQSLGTPGEFFEQQLVTLLTVAGAGGLQRGVGNAIQYKMFGPIGDDVAYFGKDKDGKQTRFTIPSVIHNQLMNIFNEPGPLIDGSKVSNLLSKVDVLLDRTINNTDVTKKNERKASLNEDQIQFIIALSLQEAEKKGQKAMVLEALKKNNIITTEEFWSQAEEGGFGNEEPTRMDYAKIEKKNAELTKKYPLLAQNELMPRDENTGQMIEPTGEYLLSLQDEIDKVIAEKGELRKDGTFKFNNTKYIDELKTEIEDLQKETQTPETVKQIADLNKQIEKAKTEPSAEYVDAIKNKQIVEQELEEYADRVGVPLNYQSTSKVHEILLKRIYDGEKLQGKGSLINLEGTTMLVTLDNGDRVRAFLGPRPGVNETMEQYKERKVAAQRASRLELPITIEHQPKSEWNDNDEAKELVFDPMTGKMVPIPYGDRLNIVSEGKVIGAVAIHDYDDANVKARRYRKAIEMANGLDQDIIHNLVINEGQIPEGDNERINQLIQDMLNDLRFNLSILPSESFGWLVNQTKNNRRLSENQRIAVLDYFNTNKEIIEKNAQIEALKSAGFKVKDVSLELTDFEGTSGVAESAAQKLNKQLNTFFPLWKSISEWKEDKKISREKIELEFFNFVNLPSFESVVDEATYLDWLSKNRDLNPEVALISEYLMLRNQNGTLTTAWKKILSATNFYRNVKLVKQVSVVINKGTISFEDLNPPQSFEDFIISFNKNIESQPQGIYTIMNLLGEHIRQRDARFRNEQTISSAERSTLKKEQFEEDLRLLRQITGIDSEIWRQYFFGKTNETTQYADSDLNTKGKGVVDFGTYDQLLENDAFRRQSDGTPKHYRQSNLMFNLLLLNKEKEEEKFKKKFINYFTKGKGSQENKNLVLSNLYKLSTASGTTGTSGRDVKGDNFSSFQAYSDLYNTADHVLESNVNNALVNYYKTIGSPIELVMVNGIHNRTLNKFEKGTPSTAMSMEDIWISLMAQFSNGSDTYMQNVGQFADKPYLYTMKVPKIFMPTKEQIAYANSIIGGQFEKTVEDLRLIGRTNNELFNGLSTRYPSSVNAREDFATERNERLTNFVTAFVYNYVVNQKDINEIFFGYVGEYGTDGYKNVTDMFKRAGSTNSPGYRLNTNVTGGVGKTFRFAVINDKKIFDKAGIELTKNGMDGCVYYSGEVGTKMQVSAGSIYSKTNKYPVLTTTKALISAKNKETNKRLLVKGNWYNIDALAKEGDSPTTKAIRDFMKEHNIDVLGIGTSSSVKKLDQGEEVQFFDEKGNVNEGVVAEDGVHVFDKSWDDVYVQQDLRHSIQPKTSKSPSQNLTTMLSLSNGKRISSLANLSQTVGLNALVDEFTGPNLEETKRKWLIDNVNEFAQPELLDLLNKGLSISDPIYRKIIRTVLASAITRESLELPINRVVTIEIPDIDGQLEGMRIAKGFDGKDHIMLAECGASVPGARTFSYQFEGDVKGAIDHVNANQDKYSDLFDSDGNLMDWEISGRNGVIPGEVVSLARVPNSGFSTLTYARLKVNFVAGNFAMIDRESQLRSSADFDGDQRYVQTVFRKEGKVINDDTQEGIANQIMKLAADNYTDVRMYKKLTHGINTDLYNSIVDNIATPSYMANNPLAFQYARLNNKVGLDMKGGMTNLLTVYSLLSRYNIPFRKVKAVEYEGISHVLTGVASDEYGAIRAHMENFLTMFFDNQKEPKVERMGFNEITGNMFVLMLIGKQSNGITYDSKGVRNYKSFDEHYNAILGKIEEQVGYFTSPLLIEFKEMMRRENGGMRKKDENVVFQSLKRSAKSGAAWNEKDVKALKTLYSAAKELTQVKALHTLTQEVPDNYTDFILAKRLRDKAKKNTDPSQKKEKGGFRLFNLRELLDRNGNFVPEFAIIDNVIKFSEEHIFNDVPENTIVGKQIYNYILEKLVAVDNAKAIPEGEEFKFEKTELSKDEMNAINSTLNNVFNIRAIGLNELLSTTKKKLISKIKEEDGTERTVINPAFTNQFPGNAFLDFLDINDAGNITIRAEFIRDKIKETTLNTIREDFDQLSPEIKDIFATYQIQMYGSSQMTSNGGFYILFGPEYKIELSRRCRTELNNWSHGDVSSTERLTIADWVLRANKSKSISSLQEFTDTEDRLVNFRSDPSLKTPIHRDTMEGIESIDDVNEFNTINGSKGTGGINADLFAWSKENTLVPMGTDKDQWFEKSGKNYEHIKKSLRPVISEHLSKRRAIAERYFPESGSMSDEQLRNMHADNPEMQVMMSFDEGLNSFIYDHLQKMFPAVEIFKSREAFMNFVKRNSRNAIRIDLNAVAHAFKNAVFIDPTRPIQEALFHEHSHIYWDALPVNDDTKQKLRELYRTIPENQKLSLIDLEEKIITDIGQAGTDFAQSQMDKSFLGKFMDHLKAFWNKVKIAFGKYEKQDLVDDMVYDIWNNRKNIRPDSRKGSAQIKDLVVFNNSVHDIYLNNTNYQATIGRIPLTGITGMINSFKYEQFDSDKTQKQLVEEFERWFQEEYKRPANDEDVYTYSEYLSKSWEESAKRGTANHKVAEEVFTNKRTITNDEINENYVQDISTGVNSYEQLRQSFFQFKREILNEYSREKYPNLQFIVEQPVVSLNHNVFGFIDLIVDLGNGHQIIYDFKTTAEEYKTRDGGLSENYRKQYGFMKSPLTSKKQSKEICHNLQLAIEKEILEEQVNDDNPDVKNIVDKMFIVPIISTVVNGKQVKARISQIIEVPGQERESGEVVTRILDNIIEVPNEKNIYTNYAKDMLQSYATSKGKINTSASYSLLKDKLEKSNIPWITKQELLNAYAFISLNVNSGPEGITRDDVGGLMQTGYRNIYNTLLMNNFTTTDEIEVDESDETFDPLNTTNINRLPFEVLLYCAKGGDNGKGYTAVEWLANRKTWYQSVRTGSNAIMRLNPLYKNVNIKWFHKKMHDTDYYFHYAGIKTPGLIGKKVIRIISPEYNGHQLSDTPVTYSIIKINKKDNWVQIKDDLTDSIETVRNLTDDEGLLVLNTEKEALDNNVTKDNYIPKYLEKAESIYSKHWVGETTPEYMTKNDAKSIKQQQRFFIARKKAWQFYDQFKNKNDVRKFIEDKDSMKEILSQLNGVKTDGVTVADRLINFFGEEMMNTIMAEQIRVENREGPSIYMPMLLNIYKIMTLQTDAIFKEFKKSAYWWSPTRKIPASKIGANWYFSTQDEAIIHLEKINTDNNKFQEELYNSVNLSSMIKTVYGKKHWKLPNDISLKGDRFKNERKYLNFLYEQIYKYVPRYIDERNKQISEGDSIENQGYPKMILINASHATRQEVISQLKSRGRQWGNVIFDIMTNNTYDRVKLRIGKNVVTLREIKDSFAIEDSTDEQVEEWMGSTTLGMKPKYWFRKTPGLRKIGMMSKPKLLQYYLRAKAIYEDGDELNDAASETGSVISSPVDVHVQYATKYLMEAQAKQLEDHIWAYYMKDLIGPLNYVLSGYEQSKSALKYIKNFTDAIVFHKSNKIGSELTAFADALQQLTSLRFISFSPMTQLFNFTVGQTQDIVREPKAYGIGVARFAIPSKASDLLTSIPAGAVAGAAAGAAVDNLAHSGVGAIIGAGVGATTGLVFSPRKVLKAINILRSHGLGNIVDEARFDTLAKRAGLDLKWGDRTVLNISYESFITLGFLPMEIVERFNQVPLFVGLMTQKEWESYDENGLLIAGHKGLSDSRAKEISERVQDVQGDYTPRNAAPFWNTSMGGLMFQFGKWAPTLIDSMVMSYHLDRRWMVRSGTIQTLALFSKNVSFWVMSANEKKKYEYLKKALMRWPDPDKAAEYNAWVNKTFQYSEELRKKHFLDLNNLNEEIKAKQSIFLEGVQDYFQMLLVASKDGNLKLKYSAQDRRNLTTTILRVALYGLTTAALIMYRRRMKQEIAFETEWETFMQRFITRYQSDLFIWTGKSTDPMGPQWGGLLVQKLASPIMATDFLIKNFLFMSHFAQATRDVGGHLWTNWRGDEEDYLRQWWRPDEAVYAKNTAGALKGEPKALYDFVGLIPSGNALKFLARQRVNYMLDKPYLQSLRDQGYDPSVVSELAQYISEDISIGEINKLADQYDAYINIIKISAIWHAIEGNEVVYRDIVNAKNLMNTEIDKLKKAAGMLKVIENNSIDRSLFYNAVEDVMKYTEFMKGGSNQSNKEKLKRLPEAIKKYEFNPGMFEKERPAGYEINLLDKTIKNNPDEKFSVFSTKK